MKKAEWSLQPNVAIDEKVAADIAKIACALQSLSVYTTLALENDDAPESLQTIVDEGLAATKRIFVW